MEMPQIRNVLNYKRPAFWMIFVAVIVCIAASVYLLTNPKEEEHTHFSEWAASLTADNIDTASVSLGYGGDKVCHFLTTSEKAELAALFNSMDEGCFSLEDSIGDDNEYYLYIGRNGVDYYFYCNPDSDSGVRVLFDEKTAAKYGAVGKSLWISNKDLEEFMVSMLSEGGDKASDGSAQ